MSKSKRRRNPRSSQQERDSRCGKPSTSGKAALIEQRPPRIVGHPLDSSFAKLSRAREHLESLGGEIMRFEGTHAYAGRVTFDATTGWHTLRVKVLRDLPRHLGAVVGDFFTNLRAALDHAVYGIALASEANADRTQFPICSSSRVFRYQCGRYLPDIPARWLPVFEVLQPYMADGDILTHPLTLLRDYANVDKHRSIHATLSVPFEHRVALEPVEPIPTKDFAGVESWVADRQPLRDEDEIIGIRFAPDPSVAVRVSGSVKLDVVFGEALLAWGDLDAIRRHAVDVVEALEDALSRAPVDSGP